MPDTEKSVSYHTFLYPIKISGSGKITELSQWESENELRFRMRSGNAADHKDKDLRREDLLFINTLRYFLPIARDFLAPAPDSAKNRLRSKAELSAVPRYFRYKGINDCENERSTYVIETSGEKIVLTLTGIKLMLLDKYNVGILRFETEYTSSLKGAAFLAKVKKINDLGRRVYSPFFDTSLNNLALSTAKKITIAEKYTIAFPTPKDHMEISAFSQLLFGENQPYSISGILDDRMFTACIVCDKALSESLACEKSNVLTKESLYEFVFLDQDTECSCQSKPMLDEQLKLHTYSRWKNSGTCHFVTEYSMMAITKNWSDSQYFAVNPFLTMYVEMVQLALLQRAILVVLEEEAVQISDRIDSAKVEKLWERYIYFQNALYMREVTFQQQGAELYDLIKRDLRLEAMNEYLSQELKQFEAYSQLRHEEAQQELTGAFTDIVLIEIVNMFLSLISADSVWTGVHRFVGATCLLSIVYLCTRLAHGLQIHWQHRGFARVFIRVLTYLLLAACLVLLYWNSVWLKLFPLLF